MHDDHDDVAQTATNEDTWPDAVWSSPPKLSPVRVTAVPLEDGALGDCALVMTAESNDSVRLRVPTTPATVIIAEDPVPPPTSIIHKTAVDVDQAVVRHSDGRE